MQEETGRMMIDLRTSSREEVATIGHLGTRTLVKRSMARLPHVHDFFLSDKTTSRDSTC